MPVSSPSRVLTAHVPQGLADKIDELAQRADRSRGWIIQQALGDWIEREEEYDRLTREGLADVDAGRVVGHREMQDWAGGLDASVLP